MKLLLKLVAKLLLKSHEGQRKAFELSRNYPRETCRCNDFKRAPVCPFSVLLAGLTSPDPLA